MLKKRKKWMTSNQINGKVYLFVLISVALLLQLVVREYLQDDQRIVEAFRVSQTNSVSGELRVQGSYPKILITQKDKENLLLFFAKGLGIDTYAMDGNKTKLTCENGKAKTEIAIVPEKSDTYIVTDVYLKEVDNLVALKGTMEALYNKLEMDSHCFIRMKGEFPRKYDIDDMNEMKDLMFDQLECDTKYAQKYAGGYEYYGYTPLLSETRKMRGQKINVQLQFEYDNQNNRTIMNLAVPFFSQE